ncbi:hypothetical protein MHYP_G00038460 [Metynnis hypsauchen]
MAFLFSQSTLSLASPSQSCCQHLDFAESFHMSRAWHTPEGVGTTVVISRKRAVGTGWNEFQYNDRIPTSWEHCGHMHHESELGGERPGSSGHGDSVSGQGVAAGSAAPHYSVI